MNDKTYLWIRVNYKPGNVNKLVFILEDTHKLLRKYTNDPSRIAFFDAFNSPTIFDELIHSFIITSPLTGDWKARSLSFSLTSQTFFTIS